MAVLKRYKVGKYRVTQTDKGLRIYDKSGNRIREDVYNKYSKNYRNTQREAGKESAAKQIRRDGKFVPKVVREHFKELYRKNPDWADLPVKDLVKKIQEIVNNLSPEEYMNLYRFAYMSRSKNMFQRTVKAQELNAMAQVYKSAGADLLWNGEPINRMDLAIKVAEAQGLAMEWVEYAMSLEGMELGIDYDIYWVIFYISLTASSLNVIMPPAVIITGGEVRPTESQWVEFLQMDT